MVSAGDVAPDDRCPCFSGDLYRGCCGPLLEGASAPTAVRLMRSRYTAFAVGDAEYLLATWHPSTRPLRVEIDDELVWRRLVVLETVAGGPFDREGVVEFEALWRQGDERGVMHERSRFVREDRRWLYVDGGVAPATRLEG
ncbi:YchJ family protein [Microbacterium sp. LTA6]|uniref:YchJ family protein n=1 Tax=unclassified Microbacterium TaxID=2609290 RepID=UPI00313A393F